MGDHFGFGGAITGNTVVVGADRHGGTGVAYLFAKTTKGLVQQAEVHGNDAKSGDALGRWVAVTSSGAP